MEILQTTHYDQFATITGNRIINKKKVEKLVEDINNGLNLLAYCPIIVYRDGEYLKIVDGQHRFETSQRLELPVYYVICEELDLRQIARLNSRSDKWSNKDFLDCYVKLGVEDYRILQQFIKDYEIIYSAAVDLLMNGKIRAGKTGMDIFRDGEFKVNFKQEAEDLAELTRDVFSRYKFRNDRYLLQAVQELQKKGLCEFDVLTQKIAAAPMLMNPQSSAKEYIYNIERVYNHNNQKRVVIF